jgi:hypothetical protein
LRKLSLLLFVLLLALNLKLSFGTFQTTLPEPFAESLRLEFVERARSAFNANALIHCKMRTSSVAVLTLATVLSSTAFITVPGSISTSIATRQTQLSAAPTDDNIFDRFSRWQMVRAL